MASAGTCLTDVERREVDRLREENNTLRDAVEQVGQIHIGQLLIMNEYNVTSIIKDNCRYHMAYMNTSKEAQQY